MLEAVSRKPKPDWKPPPGFLWKFPDLLRREGVTVYALHQHVARDVSRNALYKWGKQPPQSVDIDMLHHVLRGLSELREGKRFSASDVFGLEAP